MDKNKLSILRKLLLVLLTIIVFYNYDYNKYPACQPPCVEPPIRVNLLPPIIGFIVFLAIIAITIVLKSYDKSTAGLTLLLIIILLISAYLTSFETLCLIPDYCYFNSNLTCVKYTLYSQTSELSLNLNNTAEHKIKINGIRCITTKIWNESMNYTTEPLNQIVVIDPYSNESVVGYNRDNKVICTMENGSLDPNSKVVGFRACLNVYINYTDMTTGNTNITHGKILTVYDMPPAGWYK